VARQVLGTIWLFDIGVGVLGAYWRIVYVSFLSLSLFPSSWNLFALLVLACARWIPHIHAHATLFTLFTLPTIISVRHAEVIIALAGVFFFFLFLFSLDGNARLWVTLPGNLYSLSSLFLEREMRLLV